MKYILQRTEIQKLLANRNGYIVLALGCMGICILQLVFIVFLVNRERVILIPPGIEKSFWVSPQSVSPEYLSEMTSFFAGLRLNITPSSLIYQKETLLRYTAPEFYNLLKAQLTTEAAQIKEERLVSMFYPVNRKVDMKNMKVMIEGDLKTYVGESSLPVKRVKYWVGYRYDNGRLLVKSFEEEVNRG